MRNGHSPASMSFDLTAEQTMLRDAAERYVREHYSFEERRKTLASDEAFSRVHWRQYADMGWLGLNLPEDVGGLGCSWVESMLLFEQFGRAMVLEPLVSTVVLCGHLLDASGNQALRGDVLPSLIDGTLLLALAHDEPQLRNAPERVVTTATPTASGYRLNGSKTLVLDGPSADRLIVSAMLSGQGEPDELALFVVDRNVAGLSMDSYPLVSGQRAADVALADVACARSDLLVRGPMAPEVLQGALDRACFVNLAQALGAMEGCLDGASEYIKGRQQFGQPLSKFQALQHLVAEMFIDAQEARSILYHALARLHAAPAKRARAISAARMVIGPSGNRISSNAVQLHGGYGTTDEYPVSHYYRLLFVLDRLFGDQQFHVRRFSDLASEA